MKFAHLADCHLGSWRQPELQQLNLESFKMAIDICIKENMDFILIAGDLFDSAYPPIDTLKETFSQLKRLKDAGIACYIISGSHDYSASGKTFLDVIEKAGFCKNVYNIEKREGIEGIEGIEGKEMLLLNPTLHENIAIYGYPGKKSGMEVEELKNIKLQESPGFFKILMLHTTVTRAKGSLPIDSVNEDRLPQADYYALGHLHIDYKDLGERKFVYPGPIFPNNFQELEELKAGSFYIFDSGKIIKRELKIKDIEIIDIEITNALIATEKIISEFEKRELNDKIVLLNVSGKLQQGKTSNINFQQIEKSAKDKGAYVLLRSISQLISEEAKIDIEIEDIDKLEEEIIKKYSEQNPSKFNFVITQLMNTLSIEKQEAETSATFIARLLDEVKRGLNIELE